MSEKSDENWNEQDYALRWFWNSPRKKGKNKKKEINFYNKNETFFLTLEQPK